MVVQWLRNGVPLRWRGPAPPEEKARRRDQDEETKMELEALLKDGAFEKREARVVSPTFLIPKRDGGKRLIHDLRRVNKHIVPPRFTLRGAKDAASVTRNSNWLAALDLRHGYQQVAMDQQAREYLGAMLGKETIVSTVLPFGLNLSPYIFTRLTGWLAREIRRRFKLEVAVYIDDFLLGAATKEKLEEGVKEVKGFFAELGVVISEKKEIKPAQEVEFIGFVWNSARKTVGVTKEKRKEYRRAVKNLLRHAQSRSTWKRIIGKLGFLREAVGPTMRHVRSLLHTVAMRKDREKLIEAQGEAREDLEWWCEKLGKNIELSLETTPVTGSIVTDASDVGLGYLLREGTERNDEKRRNVERSLKSSVPEGHINQREIEAILRALQENQEKLHGRHLVWYSDSMTALAAIQRQGTQRLSKKTWQITKEVLDILEEKKIKLLPKHVPGRLNSAADALSRPREQRSEWELALGKVVRRWGPLQEDPCGATREATSLLEGLTWANKRTLLLPKPAEVARVLNYLALVAAPKAPEGDPTTWEQMAVLVTPLWRGAAWWPEVERIRVDFVYLGRLASPNTVGWARRNGHDPDWTASLVPIDTSFGPTKQGRNTKAHCGAFSSGRKREGWALEAKERAEDARTEA